jgi:adenine C2-methylase RlmN of 23S rRNA A2503 and tRNA A37
MIRAPERKSMFAALKVEEWYLKVLLKVTNQVKKVHELLKKMIEGDVKVNEMSYGNLEGTDQGNVKLLFEDNVQRIAAGIIERRDRIK